MRATKQGFAPIHFAARVKIQAYHVALFADYLEKLQNTPDGDGSLSAVDAADANSEFPPKN